MSVCRWDWAGRSVWVAWGSVGCQEPGLTDARRGLGHAGFPHWGSSPPSRNLRSGSSLVGRLDRAGVPRLGDLERGLPSPGHRLLGEFGRSSEPEMHYAGGRAQPRLLVACPGHRDRHQLGQSTCPRPIQRLEQQQPGRGATSGL